MSTLLDDPAFHRQKKNQSKSKRRYSLPKLKEPCPLTSDGTRLLESFPNNTNGGRRKSFGGFRENKDNNRYYNKYRDGGGGGHQRSSSNHHESNHYRDNFHRRSSR